MPDITMCTGARCPLKETCYRYKAKPEKQMQSYFAEPPFKGTECECYWAYEAKVEYIYYIPALDEFYICNPVVPSASVENEIYLVSPAYRSRDNVFTGYLIGEL